MGDKPINVLLIEDNPGDARLIRELLSEPSLSRFTLECATRLSKGMEYLTRGGIDVVLLDLNLPDSSGLETFIKIKAHTPQVPVVILTGTDDELLGIKAVREGAQDYLLKGDTSPGLLTRSLRYAIERRWAEVVMANYQKSLRSLASKVSLAEENERRRIAVEVHDNMSQNLAFCAMRLAALIKTNPENSEPFKEIYEMIKQLAADTRSLSFELSPPVLYDIGLEAAVKELCERTEKKCGLVFSFEDDGQPKPLDKDVRVLIFQMVRELLVNVIKHAHAKNVKVGISRLDNTVRLTVEDDGVGFDTKILHGGKRADGFGLFSIRERLQYIGGRIEADSGEGKGSCIILEIPINEN